MQSIRLRPFVAWSFLILASSAGANTVQNHGPEGPVVYTILTDPGNASHLYVGTFGAGILESNDGGQAWTALNQGLEGYLAGPLARDPQDPSVLYTSILTRGVFKSVNGGQSWTRLSTTGLNLQISSLVTDASGTLLAGAADGIYLWSGSSWSHPYAATSSTGITSMGSDPSVDGKFYALDLNTFLKSTSNGSSWSSFFQLFIPLSVVPFPPTPTTLYSGAVTGVYRSTSTGNPLFLQVGLAGTAVQPLAFDPLDPNTIYAGGVDGKVYKSTQAGSNFSATNTAGLLLDTTEVLSLGAAAPAGTSVYAGTLGAGLFKTTNGGSAWSASHAGIGAVVSGLGLGGGSPPALYAGVFGGGMSKSTNGGLGWSPSNGGLPTGNAYRIYSLLVHPSDPNTLYMGTHQQGVYKSTNGGASWSFAGSSSAQPAGLIQDLAVQQAGPPLRLLAATKDSGIYRFTDSGSSSPWTATSQGDGQSFACVLADPQDPNLAYAGRFDAAGTSDPSDQLMKSSDAGQNWSNASTGLPAADVLAIAWLNGSLYAGTDGFGVYRSTNRAQSWSASNAGLPSGVSITALEADARAPGVIYAGTGYQGIYKSIDSGQSWSLVPGTAGPLYRALAFDPTAGSRFYAASSAGVAIIDEDTPTRTPTPNLTQTPTPAPPTETPTQTLIPTSTPTPPSPTDTPTGPTLTPTPTPSQAPPTDTPTGPTAPPTDTPTAAPSTATPTEAPPTPTPTLPTPQAAAGTVAGQLALALLVLWLGLFVTSARRPRPPAQR